MFKDYDSWNKEKKVVDQKIINQEVFFYVGEIWWCSVGLNVGVEIDGKNINFERPVLVITKFNKDLAFVIPLTTKGKDNKYYFPLTYSGVSNFAVLSQMKPMSTKRFLRKVGTIPESVRTKIVEKIRNIL